MKQTHNRREILRQAWSPLVLALAGSASAGPRPGRGGSLRPRPQQVGEIQWPAAALAWSPDGSRLAMNDAGYGDGAAIWAMNPPRRLHTFRMGYSAPTGSLIANTVYTVGWSPDGKQLALGTHSGEVFLYDPPSAKELKRWRVERSAVRDPAWNPRGTHVAATAGNAVEIWSVRDAQRIQVVRPGKTIMEKGEVYIDYLWTVGWSADGTRLAAGGGMGSLWVWPFRNPDRLQVRSGHADTIYAVAWQPGGSQIASGSTDGTVRIWEAERKAAVAVLQAQKGVWSLAWDPAGRYLASGGMEGAVHVWDVARSRLHWQTRIPDDGWVSVAWSPDGKRLATGTYKGILIWRMR